MERAKKRTTRKALKTEREVGLATCTCTSFDYEGKFIKNPFNGPYFSYTAQFRHLIRIKRLQKIGKTFRRRTVKAKKSPEKG